jgi:hypothetical protein
MELLIVQFPPNSYHCICFRSECCPNLSVLRRTDEVAKEKVEVVVNVYRKL